VAPLQEAVESSLAGTAMSTDVLAFGVLGLAFVAGASSMFAPCSVGLLPAYMGFLLNAKGGRRATLPAGLLTAAGIVTLYAVLAVLLWLVRDSLAPVIRYLGPVVGGLLVLLGLLMLFGFDWERIAKRIGLGKVDGRRGFYAFGVGYGLAAFGCTGPIFVPILLAGFAQGTLLGVAAFAVYALAIASLVLFVAYLVGSGQQTRLRRLLSHTKAITRVSALLLIGAGAYLIWFDLTAFRVI
jgi:cytochrome c biogenesis protein CcdA